MYDVLVSRIRQKKRTIAFPKNEPAMPERFRGLPKFNPELCGKTCRKCSDVCPTGALSPRPDFRIDLGKCLFCTDCIRACPRGAIAFTSDYRLSVRSREDLKMDGQTVRLAEALDRKARKLFGRSLRLRQVSAGGCNACEADVNVLGTVVYDLGRFGVQFVASPRHADGLLVTGPVTRNMLTALKKTHEAVPDPKIVIAVGACAISGGPFSDHPEVLNGADPVLPVDLYIPGCPPHPVTILDGILRLLGRRE